MSGGKSMGMLLKRHRKPKEPVKKEEVKKPVQRKATQKK